LSLYTLSHGDTRHIVLFPANMKECFEMAMDAFDLAEFFQQPVFVASDLDLGMNNWMTEPFDYPTRPLNRGKVLSAEDLETIGEFARYRDVDGDGVPYRTLPGTRHPLAAYFTRGSGHNDKARYSERPEDYQGLMDRLARKHETARKMVPRPEIRFAEQARIGIIAYGSTDAAIEECQDQLSQEYGLATHYFRIRALPLPSELKDFVDQCERVYVVEQNRDGQMADLIRLEVPQNSSRIHKILHYNGLPIDARFVTDCIVNNENLQVKE